MWFRFRTAVTVVPARSFQWATVAESPRHCELSKKVCNATTSPRGPSIWPRMHVSLCLPHYLFTDQCVSHHIRWNIRRAPIPALCLFEEDAGMTDWRHSTPRGGPFLGFSLFFGSLCTSTPNECRQFGPRRQLRRSVARYLQCLPTWLHADFYSAHQPRARRRAPYSCDCVVFPAVSPTATRCRQPSSAGEQRACQCCTLWDGPAAS